MAHHNTNLPFVELLDAVRGCRICESFLPAGPRPVLQIDPGATILVAGQAPGRRVHASGLPFDDPSGDRLRDWMGISRDLFYDASRIAIIPMGFCYPGTGRSGDLPPRPECAPRWRKPLLDQLNRLALTLVIGQYAQRWHLPGVAGNLTETVRAFDEHAGIIALPHPSPRNNIWLKRNPWFEATVLPGLKRAVDKALTGSPPSGL
ncbi:MAG: uracil-DNA glycosylase family protein [Pseudomonadota bacterium]